MNPLSTRNTDLMKKDLVSMLRGSHAPNAKYAVVDSDRRMVHTTPTKVKGPTLKKEWMRKPAPIKSAKLRQIFG